ncbi:MAG: ABC transporter permease [Pyrinomonadaceae bacterium]|nr:ABC transporter permease [Pyrinomonadaceae bacterium]
MRTFLEDLHFGLRSLSRKPGFTAVVVLTLALGIGANSLIFTLANAVLIRPLPVAEPDRVVSFYATSLGSTRQARFSWLNYADYRDQNDVFTGLIAVTQVPLTIGQGDQSEPVLGEVVSGNYFSLLGVNATAGRIFTAEDDHSSGDRVVVVGFSFWQRRFGADPGLINRTITLNGTRFTVIGIANKEFRTTTVGPATDVWIPMMQAEAWLGADWNSSRSKNQFRVMGRLKSGVTREQAQASATAIALRLSQAYPEFNKTSGVELEQSSLIEGKRRTFVVSFFVLLWVVVGLVLLIACANVANLLLVRALSRQRELAVRQALGATRLRLIRLFLTESMLLSLLGGVVGTLTAAWASNLLKGFDPLPSFPLEFDFSIDRRVLGGSMLITLVTGVVLGLVPAWQASKPNLVRALRDDARTGTGTLYKSRLRGLLVISQVSISLVLLLGAALMLQSLRQMQAVSPGFNPDQVFAMDFDLELKGFSEDEGRRFYQSMIERAAALPGVESISMSSRAPLDISTPEAGVQIEGHISPPGKTAIPISFVRISPGYFRTMAIPILKGRDFSARDDEKAPRVAIINETMAQRFWPGEEPIGKRFKVTADKSGGESPADGLVEVIAVARNSKYRTLGEDPTPHMYLPLWQDYNAGMSMLVRTSVDPRQMMRTVRGELLMLDQDPQAFFPRTMEEHTSVVQAPAKIAAVLFGLFGLIALFLAALGIYGVISYSSRQRIREMGIRVALGAQPLDVFKLILGEGLVLALIGVTIGLLASFALTRFLSSLLFGVSATDPLTFTSIALSLVAVALLACYLPARRATKVDPLVALRCE